MKPDNDSRNMPAQKQSQSSSKATKETTDVYFDASSGSPSYSVREPRKERRATGQRSPQDSKVLGLLQRYQYLTTGEVRELLKKNPPYEEYDSSVIRTVLRRLARNDWLIEIKTPNPGNYGGHIWLYTDDDPVHILIDFAKIMFEDPMEDYGYLVDDAPPLYYS